MLAALAVLTLALAGATGCASRSVPDAPPATSAASTSAAETPRTTVTAALDSDPPLPGKTDPGKTDPRWPGLRDPKPGAAHEGHGHHHHAPAGATHAR